MKQPKRKFLSFALILLGFLGCTSAIAYVGPQILVPPNVDADQPVGVELTAGSCDAFVGDPQAIYPQLTVNGSQIHLTVFSVHFTNPIECNFPPEQYIHPLGSFGAGQYTVTVDRIYPDVGGLTTERLAQLPLVVGGVGTPAAQLPVDAPLALLIAILALMMMAWMRFRHSRK